MRDRNHYISLSLVFLAIIGIPAIQTLIRAVPEIPLNGVVQAKPLPELNWHNWMHFDYQPDFNRRVEQTFGFRPAFVRLYNQAEYSLFRRAHGSGVVLGKEGYLYEEWFINAYYGNDYIGDTAVGIRLKRLKEVRGFFNRMGKELMVMITPGKASFFPEFIPDHWKAPLKKTNYEAFADGIRQAGIPLLDFNTYYLGIKDTTVCPLFPKTGTHWSHYAARLAADSLSGYLSALLKRPLPEFRVGPSMPADTVLYPDNDLEMLMNLIFPLERLPLCYPEVTSGQADGFNMPKAIVVGDSFFWELMNIPLTGRIFSDLKFWYYNSSVYPDSQTDSVHTRDLKFPDAFRDAELIILQANGSNIQNIGWGFQERVLNEAYQRDWKKEYEKMVREYIQAIHNTPAWERKIMKEASEKGVPADTMLRRHAVYMVDQYLLTHDMF